MNPQLSTIFVLSTGRCGSLTFTEACRFAENYTVEHEGLALRHDLAYPPAGHIEVNNRLIWFAGLLDRKFPAARYVHLTRDPEAVAQSLARREQKPFQIMSGWRSAVRMGWFPHRDEDPERPFLDDCREYVAALNSLIEVFCRSPRADGDHRDWIPVRIEQPADFDRFWAWAGCQGDLSAARSRFRERYNAS